MGCYLMGCKSIAVACFICLYGSAARGQSTTADFAYKIRPILSKNCFPCHGPDEAHRQADLRLDDRQTAIDSGAIVPNEPNESEVIRRITSDDPDERMPPEKSGRQL